MKYVSQFKKLKVILRPTRRVVQEIGGNSEVIIHPAVVAEFENGFFDTKIAFPIMSSRIECCELHKEQLASEDRLIKALDGHLDFGSAFKQFYEETKEDRLAKLKAEIAQLESAPEADTTAPAMDVIPAGDSNTESIGQPKETVSNQELFEKYNAMDMNALREVWIGKFGFKCPVISKENLIKTLMGSGEVN